MALKITSHCIACNACKLVCPEKAVIRKDGAYAINAARCTECASIAEPCQCAEICPVEMAIVDSQGRAINPPGSLIALIKPSDEPLTLIRS